MDPQKALEQLQARLGYRFDDVAWLKDALTHRSFVNEHPDVARQDNERLEFLGDAVLDLAASALLFAEYPQAPEGELSRRRADMVNEAALAQIARELEVGPALRLGRGEHNSGGRDKPRLLASAVEAIVAAVHLDSDERGALEVARRLLEPLVEAIAPGERDFKSRLQERVQAARRPPPEYLLVETEGPDHDRVFHVRCEVQGEELGRGAGRSKAAAAQRAARAGLEALRLQDDHEQEREADDE